MPIIYPDERMRRWEVGEEVIIADADNYYTKAQVDKKIEEITVSGVTEEKAQEMIDESLVNYYTKSEIDTKDDTQNSKIEAISGNVSSLSGSLESQIEAIETELEGDYATKEYVSGYTYSKAVTEDMIEDYVSAFTYDKQTIEDMIEEGGGFIPENYYTKNEVNAFVDDLEAADSVLSGRVDNLSTTMQNEAQRAQNAESALSAEIQTISGESVSSGEVETMIDGAVSGKADTSAVTEAIAAAVSGKADTSAVTEAISAAVSGKADSSNVYTKTEVDTALNGKQNTLSAGSGISISNNVISAKIWSGTKSQYEELTTKDSDTVYLIYNE